MVGQKLQFSLKNGIFSFKTYLYWIFWLEFEISTSELTRVPNFSSIGQKIKKLEFWPRIIPKIAWWCHTYAGINLTGYHPPRLTAGPLIFPLKSLPPGQLFSAKLWPPDQKNETKIPTPGHNLFKCLDITEFKCLDITKKGTLFYKSSFFPNFP